MTDEELKEIEQRANAATPGPWNTFRRRDGAGISPVRVLMFGDIGEDNGDLNFIAAARTDVPALIAEVRRLNDALNHVQDRAMAYREEREAERDAKEVRSAEANQLSDELRRMQSAVAEEREACAQMLEAESRRLMSTTGPNHREIEAIAVALDKFAAAIRARGKP